MRPRLRRHAVVASVLVLLLSLVPGGVFASSVDVDGAEPAAAEGATSPAAASAAVVTSGSRRSGAVALTFDDGWDRSACARIARTLRSKEVKGTFFINGVHLRKAPERWRRILRGMPVANHSRSHPDLTTLSSAGIRRQLQTNEAIHERILERQMLKIVRPPYGAYDSRVRGVAAELGYERLVLWNVDTRDWTSSATVGSVVARATGARAGSIILMHCGPDVTPAALPAIIRHYRSRGIRMVGLGALLRD